MENREQFDCSEFIMAVRNEEALWNPSSPKYRDVLFRNQRWKEISKIFFSTETGPVDLQVECKQLREKYVREKNKMQNKGKSGSAGGSICKWEFFEEMKFIDSVYKNRKTFPSVNNQRYKKDNVQLDLDEDLLSQPIEQFSSEVELDSLKTNSINEIVQIAKSLAPKPTESKEFADYISRVMVDIGEYHT